MKEGSAPSPIHIHSDDIIYEIFTWSPAKSLMRFKSINKFWNSKISSDFCFIQLHRRRSSAGSREKLLLHLTEYKREVERWEHNLIFTSTDGREHINKYIYNHYSKAHTMTAMDGFVCFYGWSSTNFSASLHNLFTHESILLPEDSEFYKGILKRYILYIGFDSSHSLCKILRITNPIRGGYEPVYEIYMVGEAKHSWRKISPSFQCRDYYYSNVSGVCINGIIYWISRYYLGSFGNRIMAFDVTDEKFYLISIPHDCCLYNLTNVDGVLTMVDPHSYSSHPGIVIKLWKLEDYKNHVWATATLLVDFSPKLFAFGPPLVVGTLDNGEILIIQYLFGGVTLIYHDRTRNIPKIVELSQPLSRLIDLAYKHNWSTYVESIMPLTSISNKCI